MCGSCSTCESCACIDTSYKPVTQQEIHTLAVEKGWWEDKLPTDRVPEALMLIVTEIGEAMEHWRDLDLTNPRYSFLDEKGKPDGLGIELADAIIRIRDLGEALGFDVEELVRVKHEFNKTRPRLHGRNR